MSHPDIKIEIPTLSGELDLKIKKHLKKIEKPMVKEKDIFDKTKSKINIQKRPKLFRKKKTLKKLI